MLWLVISFIFALSATRTASQVVSLDTCTSLQQLLASQLAVILPRQLDNPLLTGCLCTFPDLFASSLTDPSPYYLAAASLISNNKHSIAIGCLEYFVNEKHDDSLAWLDLMTCYDEVDLGAH